MFAQRVARGPQRPQAAFRVLNSSSFTPTSLTRAGSSGETPFLAALRLGCAQVLAAIMLHPGFDFSATVRRYNQRNDLMNYALRHADPEARTLMTFPLRTHAPNTPTQAFHASPRS